MIKDRVGLSCWHGEMPVMPSAHSHDDVEINLCHRGALTYRLTSGDFPVSAGQLVLFWASQPHQVIQREQGTIVAWLVIPLATLLGWPMAGTLRAQLIASQPVIIAAEAVDEPAFRRWSADLTATTDDRAERTEIALLEIQAWFRRLSLAVSASTTAIVPSHEADLAGAMALYVADRYCDQLTIADVAAQVHLHPHHAMAVFRRSFGMTIGNYLTQCRIAASRRLLIDTNRPVVAIANDVGYSSLSTFYTAFGRTTGTSPHRYRREHT